MSDEKNVEVSPEAFVAALREESNLQAQQSQERLVALNARLRMALAENENLKTEVENLRNQNQSLSDALAEAMASDVTEVAGADTST